MKNKNKNEKEYLSRINAIIENTDDGVFHYIEEDRVLHVAVSKGENIDQITIVVEKREDKKMSNKWSMGCEKTFV